MSEVSLYLEKDVEAFVVELQRLLEFSLPEVHAGPGFVLRVSGLGIQVYKSGLRVSGLGFQVSGFGFRVSGLGFRIKV